MFFFGRDYVTKAEGSVLKTVVCTYCGHEYVYEMKRKATGKGLSVYYLDNQGAQDRSQRDAQSRLDAFLRDSCDPVPCPQCGSYQPAMIQRMKRVRFKWIREAVPYWIFFSLFLPFFVLSMEPLSLSEKVIAVSLWLSSMPLLLLLRHLANANFDPNDQDLNHRLELGRKLTLTKEEYLKKLEQQIRSAAEGLAEK
jgi:hypothetical protein